MKDDAGILSLPLPSFVPRRYRPGNLGNWSAHLAFAYDLIGALQPRLIVELGTHWGESYFGFCQSVAEHGLDCLCYAVDHWLGDAHAERYGEEVYEEVRQYNETHYKAFSYLLRAPFDDALVQFQDGSIDLLHIDGLHTYEAASHDFRTWLPKVRPGGIVLLHDIAVRHADFGIWLLWDEIKAEFPETFEFHHSWGLGVLRKPGEEAQRPALLEALFNSPAPIQENIRRLYVIYGSHLENILVRASQPPAEAQTAAAQLEAATLRAELNAAQEQRARAAGELYRVAAEKDELRRQLENRDRTHARTLEELASARSSLELEQKMRRSMESSRSWRITKPMRSFMLAVRGKPRTDELK
jgi:Methyltransferase domain